MALCALYQNIAETDLSAHYTVWHVVVEMVQAGVATSGGMPGPTYYGATCRMRPQDGSDVHIFPRFSDILWRTNPHLSELCYQLLYHLCKNPKTATPALEYLRTIEV